MKIVWLNGSFGAGKTTTAGELVKVLPRARIFDSEKVGSLLEGIIREQVDNFQDWPPWRSLVVHAAVETLRYTGGTLIIPQTVLNESYATEIFQGLRAAGLVVHHFLLHVEQKELIGRIEGDEADRAAREWRLDHVARYASALPWLRESADVIDTTHLPSGEVVREIAGRLERVRPPGRGGVELADGAG
jgi:shikimate kinase